MKGAVYQRGRAWTYRFRGPEKDSATGEYPWISKGGFVTEKEAWKACRDAMREADRGRVVRPSTRTIAQFFDEWFAAVEAQCDRPGPDGVNPYLKVPERSEAGSCRPTSDIAFRCLLFGVVATFGRFTAIGGAPQRRRGHGRNR